MHLCELEISLTADTQQQQYLFAIISTDQTCSKHSRIKYKVKVLEVKYKYKYFSRKYK